jgi:hypothetical protein
MMNDLNTDAGREQILQYMKQGGGSKMEDYYDPQLSANATYQMFQHYKTLAWANYNPYRPWGAYKGYSELHNVSQAKLDEARAYAKQKKYIGDAGFADAGYAVNPYDQAPSFTDNSRVGGSGYGSMSLSAGGITFNNTFHIQLGSGGGSRSDVDTAARQIASRLEAQMKRVVARNT